MKYRKFADLTKELQEEVINDIFNQVPKLEDSLSIKCLVQIIANTVDKLIERGFGKPKFNNPPWHDRDEQLDKIAEKIRK